MKISSLDNHGGTSARREDSPLETTRVTVSGSRRCASGSSRVPAMIGRFVVLRRLGKGGVGEVFLAHDSILGRSAAVKLLRRSVRDPDQRERLVREARAMALISHPNVASVYEVGTVGERTFVAMEYIPGRTLRQWQSRRAPSWRETVEIYAQAARGLAAAHRLGFVHRDVKPSNLILGDDGRVRVLDFGLVTLCDDDETDELVQGDSSLSVTGRRALRTDLTRAGSIMGTPDYMAPEQFAGEPALPATDQFGFCASLYEALYGERPFVGETYEALVDNVTRGRLRPRVAGAAVPRWLYDAVVRGLDPDPERRHESMDALIAAIDRPPARARSYALGLVGAAAMTGVLAFASATRGEAPAGGAASEELDARVDPAFPRRVEMVQEHGAGAHADRAGAGRCEQAREPALAAEARDDPEDRLLAGSLRAGLTRAHVLARVGALQASQELAADVARRSGERGYASIEAEALLTSSQLPLTRPRAELTAELDHAVAAAVVADVPALAAAALSQRMYHHATRGARAVAAHDVPLAAAFIERALSSGALGRRLLDDAGAVLHEVSGTCRAKGLKRALAVTIDRLAAEELDVPSAQLYFALLTDDAPERCEGVARALELFERAPSERDPPAVHCGDAPPFEVSGVDALRAAYCARFVDSA